MNDSEMMIRLQRINNFHMHNQYGLQNALLKEQLLASSRYADPRCLNRFEYETSEAFFEPHRSFLIHSPVQGIDFGPFESC
jgi:hypothetical protein